MPTQLRSVVGLARAAKQQEIRANAHETRDSISLISYAACLCLSLVILAQFTDSSNVWHPRNREKRLFWGFNVVQGHRCWYHRKARQ